MKELERGWEAISGDQLPAKAFACSNLYLVVVDGEWWIVNSELWMANRALTEQLIHRRALVSNRHSRSTIHDSRNQGALPRSWVALIVTQRGISRSVVSHARE